MLSSLYRSPAIVACFDNEGAADAGAAAGDPNNGGIVPGADGRFSQGQLNEVLAKDRRKHQAKLEKTIEDMQARQSDGGRARILGQSVGRLARTVANQGTATRNGEDAVAKRL